MKYINNLDRTVMRHFVALVAIGVLLVWRGFLFHGDYAEDSLGGEASLRPAV